MNESLKKAHAYGMHMVEACFSDAIREGNWIHRSGVIFAHPGLRDDVLALWPSVKVVGPIGIVSDWPELVN